jgi:hypothetical protein
MRYGGEGIKRVIAGINMINLYAWIEMPHTG